jgi:hypothetical protein
LNNWADVPLTIAITLSVWWTTRPTRSSNKQNSFPYQQVKLRPTFTPKFTDYSIVYLQVDTTSSDEVIILLSRTVQRDERQSAKIDENRPIVWANTNKIPQNRKQPYKCFLYYAKKYFLQCKMTREMLKVRIIMFMFMFTT